MEILGVLRLVFSFFTKKIFILVLFLGKGLFDYPIFAYKTILGKNNKKSKLLAKRTSKKIDNQFHQRSFFKKMKSNKQTKEEKRKQTNQ